MLNIINKLKIQIKWLVKCLKTSIAYQIRAHPKLAINRIAIDVTIKDSQQCKLAAFHRFVNQSKAQL